MRQRGPFPGRELRGGACGPNNNKLPSAGAEAGKGKFGTKVVLKTEGPAARPGATREEPPSATRPDGTARLRTQQQ